MRTYGQYCAAAKALDVVGDRWTLLIVRELLVRGGCRYTDLRHGLPGIATNLLSDRLTEMEEAGLVRREAAPPPVATTLYHLTSRGAALEPVLHALGRWGAPLLAGSAGDEYRSHWLAVPARILLADSTPEKPPVVMEVRTGEQPMVVETADGGVRTRMGAAERPDAIVEGPPAMVLGLFAGRLDLASARAHGLRYEGDERVIERLQPAHRAARAAARKKTGSRTAARKRAR